MRSLLRRRGGHTVDGTAFCEYIIISHCDCPTKPPPMALSYSRRLGLRPPTNAAWDCLGLLGNSSRTEHGHQIQMETTISVQEVSLLPHRQ
jgi:hypothetical protein